MRGEWVYCLLAPFFAIIDVCSVPPKEQTMTEDKRPTDEEVRENLKTLARGLRAMGVLKDEKPEKKQ